MTRRYVEGSERKKGPKLPNICSGNPRAELTGRPRLGHGPRGRTDEEDMMSSQHGGYG